MIIISGLQAIFIISIIGFSIIGIALIICEDLKRKWIKDDKNKEKSRKSHELYVIRMNRLRHLWGNEQLGEIKRKDRRAV